MIILLSLLSVGIVAIHKIVMKSVENYEYGGGSFREWAEFERQYGYGK